MTAPETRDHGQERRWESIAACVLIAVTATSPAWLVAIVQAMEVTR